MTIAEMLLIDFDQEMASTRRVLERLPDDQLDWKPNDKSNTIGWNGSHLAEIVGWVEGIINQTSWDIAPPGETPETTPPAESRQQVLDLFDANVAKARAAIASTPDDAFHVDWTLLAGGQEIFTFPRQVVIRVFVTNHIIHHRAVLTTYYRLNDIPVPGMYGPSADEN